MEIQLPKLIKAIWLFALILEQIPEYKRKVRQLNIRIESLKEKYKDKKEQYATEL